MKVRKPDYYDRFQCIAGACSDSCCIGWEIDVDGEHQEVYRNVSGELGIKLKTCIDWENGHFILCGKEERCPFLNAENLCDLIIDLGEESLCEICREHPRYYEWYDGLTEVGIGLCCEAAARLVLEQETPARFVVEEKPEQNEEPEQNGETEESELIEVLMKARETAYVILQNRKHSIWERMEQLLTYVEELQEALDFENLNELEESAEYYKSINRPCEQEGVIPISNKAAVYYDVINMCRQLEAMDEAWPEILDDLEASLNREDEFLQIECSMMKEVASRDYEYEHLAVYFVYRYFMKCRIDEDVYSKGRLAVFCVRMIHLLDILTYSKKGELTKEDRVQNAKRCSKEIEYSEDNLETLAELFWQCGAE